MSYKFYIVRKMIVDVESITVMGDFFSCMDDMFPEMKLHDEWMNAEIFH